LPPLIVEYTSVDEALAQVTSLVLPPEKAKSVDSALSLGRTLAEDIVASSDSPPFPASHMDGYALASAATKGARPGHPQVLKIVGAIGPGERFPVSLGAGQAIRVATGAVLPEGSDAVLPAESVTVRRDEIFVSSALESGSFVYGAGEDYRKGELLLARGRTVMPQDIGLLIASGRRRVRVFPRPRVSVIPTGSELTTRARPGPGKVVESHSAVFRAMCGLLGCETVDAGIVGDDPKALAIALRRAFASSDMVLTLGGTSAGQHDLVVGAVEALRPEVLVHGLKLDRGRVAGIASVRGAPILMMPGPIQAAMNAFLMVGIPLIDRLSSRAPRRIEVPCRLSRPWTARRRFPGFLKVVYVKVRPGDLADPIAGETESIRMITDSDGYFVVPESVQRLEGGAAVRVRLFPGDGRIL